MKKEEIRLRVQRVLEGSRNVEHLNRLFNWLRFRSHGDPTIKEVGDFAAHQDRRDKGMAWKRAGDIFHNARMFIMLLDAAKKGRQFDVSSKQFQRSMLASLDLIGASEVHKETGIGAKKAKSIIDAAAKAQPIQWNATQRRLIDFLMTRFSPAPVFTQQTLSESLEGVLLKEGLIYIGDKSKVHSVAEFVSVYVISLMHLCEVDLGDGETAVLEAGVDTADDNLMIGARMENVVGKLGIGTPLFATSCKAADWLDGHMDAPWGSHFTIAHPLELTAEGRLRELD